ncbi:MAG: hypothetical protein IKJ26_01120 [Clostridia bacterium]|nr:hypothetical protein [Clostridia bacterium]
MNILSWLPFQKRTDDEPQPEPGTAGRITGVSLSALTDLTRPFAQDPFYRLRPPFSAQAAKLSLELADMTYSLEIDPWLQAGWNDVSVLIDDELHAGVSRVVSSGGETLRSMIDSFRLMRARAALKERNPISQLMGALRQRERSDTIKALCMMHSLPDGGYVLAIGFMGTGRRFYDWFSNFRFTTEEGFHRGFYQLCQSFEDNADAIEFPGTAKELGLEKLTLGDVLMEMRSLSSRFRLWMAGHSQGGAVMQVFTHRLMNDWGVLAQNMVGYGFASPTVATGKLVYDPAAYPLYHILNQDDVVPFLGAVVHLGMCLEYPSDEAMRQTVYEPVTDEDDREAIRLLAPLRAGMTDTASAAMHMTAFLQCVMEEKGEAGLNELMSSPWMTPFLDRVITQAGDRALDLFDRLRKVMQEGYAALTGRLMNPQQLFSLRQTYRPIVQQVSARRILNALTWYAVPPHQIVSRTSDGDGAYAFIAKAGLHALKPFIWIKSAAAPAVRRYAPWTDSAVWPEHAQTVQRIRRGMRVPHRAQSKMRVTLSAQRSR